MGTAIRLLGRPGAWRDRNALSLRGRKVWLLLAVLLLEDTPVTRDRLARMLFVDVADPGASLRWNLSQLRRILGVEPTAQLWDSVAAPAGGDRRVTGRGVVLAQLEAGPPRSPPVRPIPAWRRCAAQSSPRGPSTRPHCSPRPWWRSAQP